MPYARKVDNTHGDVVSALRRVGYLVADCSGMGRGFPDLVVYRTGQPIRLVEVKSKGGVITAEQEKFMALGWPVTVVWSADDALAKLL
jgi:DUF917 family protein